MKKQTEILFFGKMFLMRWSVFSLATNGFGLGEGGLVGCSNLAECVCPLLPNPCYSQYGLLSTKL